MQSWFEQKQKQFNWFQHVHVIIILWYIKMIFIKILIFQIINTISEKFNLINLFQLLKNIYSNIMTLCYK
jgi:hypothetical protein